jgi:hypothetical protein
MHCFFDRTQVPILPTGRHRYAAFSALLSYYLTIYMDHAQVLILACIKFQPLAVPYDARDEYLRYIAKPNNCEVAVVDSHWTSFGVDGTGKYGTWSPVEVTFAGYISRGSQVFAYRSTLLASSKSPGRSPHSLPSSSFIQLGHGPEMRGYGANRVKLQSRTCNLYPAGILRTGVQVPRPESSTGFWCGRQRPPMP